MKQVSESGITVITNAISSTVVLVLAAVTDRLRATLVRTATSDRGDVPGWVLVTVMTAGLVTGLWMVADDQLTALLSKAINSVSQ